MKISIRKLVLFELWWCSNVHLQLKTVLQTLNSLYYYCLPNICNLLSEKSLINVQIKHSHWSPTPILVNSTTTHCWWLFVEPTATSINKRDQCDFEIFNPGPTMVTSWTPATSFNHFLSCFSAVTLESVQFSLCRAKLIRMLTWACHFCAYNLPKASLALRIETLPGPQCAIGLVLLILSQCLACSFVATFTNSIYLLVCLLIFFIPLNGM